MVMLTSCSESKSNDAITIARDVDFNERISNNESFDNNRLIDLYKSELDLDIEYPFTVESSQYESKLNMLIASGDLPDIMEVNSQQLMQLILADKIMDLTDVYEKYANPILKEMLAADRGLCLESGKKNGKLYGIPQTNDVTSSGQFIWIRTDWLEYLKLEEPTTIDDLLMIADAFTKQDPDNNSINDTYALAINKDLFSEMGGIYGFFNSFGAYPNIWIRNENKVIEYGGIAKENKEALRVLNQMYENNQVNLDFVMTGEDEIAELLIANKVGMVYGVSWLPTWPLQLVINNNESADFKAYKIMTYNGNEPKMQLEFPVQTWFCVKKGSKHPEALVKMLNLFIDKYLNDTSEYIVTEDGTQVFKFAPVYGWPLIDTNHIALSNALEKKDKSLLDEFFQSAYDRVIEYRNGDRSQWYVNMQEGTLSAKHYCDYYFNNDLFVQDAFYGAATKGMLDKYDTLLEMQIRTYIEIIMGRKHIDEYDIYVDNWLENGGKEITDEINKYY